MLCRTVDIRNQDSQDYARLDIYALESSEEMPNSRLRPMVIICPGGAYAWTSHREGEPIAMKFLAEGINAAVLWYSVKPACFPTALLELAASVKYIRENAGELHTDMNRIDVAGFSAGGHLAASYACFWNCDFVRAAFSMDVNKAGWLKPDGLILGYPVLTAGEKTHAESMINLIGARSGAWCKSAYAEIISRLGADAETSSCPNADTETSSCRDANADERPADETIRRALSLENQVTADVPRAFIWHTQTDGSVPVENTLLFVNALQKQKINYELHIYPEGGHGIALANEITLGRGRNECVPTAQGWIELAARWVRL